MPIADLLVPEAPARPPRPDHRQGRVRPRQPVGGVPDARGLLVALPAQRPPPASRRRHLERRQATRRERRGLPVLLVRRSAPAARSSNTSSPTTRTPSDSPTRCASSATWRSRSTTTNWRSCATATSSTAGPTATWRFYAQFRYAMSIVASLHGPDYDLNAHGAGSRRTACVPRHQPRKPEDARGRATRP